MIQNRHLVEDTIEYPIQINGKVRTRMMVPTSAGLDEVRALAQVRLATPIDDEEPRKVIVVPGMLVNVVFDSGVLFAAVPQLDVEPRLAVLSGRRSDHRSDCKHDR